MSSADFVQEQAHGFEDHIAAGEHGLENAQFVMVMELGKPACAGQQTAQHFVERMVQ